MSNLTKKSIDKALAELRPEGLRWFAIWCHPVSALEYERQIGPVDPGLGPFADRPPFVLWRDWRIPRGQFYLKTKEEHQWYKDTGEPPWVPRTDSEKKMRLKQHDYARWGWLAACVGAGAAGAGASCGT